MEHCVEIFSKIEVGLAKLFEAWLNQNSDFGWGGEPAYVYENDSTIHSSVEETALAIEALLGFGDTNSVAVENGLSWLIDRVERNEHQNAAPIGFYFAKLWYYEDLYPVIFTVGALASAKALTPKAESQVTMQAM